MLCAEVVNAPTLCAPLVQVLAKGAVAAGVALTGVVTSLPVSLEAPLEPTQTP